jgi:hypothetical protein
MFDRRAVDGMRVGSLRRLCRLDLDEKRPRTPCEVWVD